MDRRVVRTALREAAEGLSSFDRPRFADPNAIAHYFAWVTRLTEALHGLVAPQQIDELVQIHRIRPVMNVDHPGLSAQELWNLHDSFHRQLSELEQQVERWSGPETFVALDTNAYIKGDRIEEADLHALLDTGPAHIHILVPLAVVDELDRLKDSGNQHVRWRAGYTLAVFDRLFRGPNAQPRLQDEPDRILSVELLLDDPGHSRLPEIDEEIIERLVSAQSLAAREITLITYDTAMCLRARRAGLPAMKPQQDLGDEPDNPKRPRRNP